MSWTGNELGAETVDISADFGLIVERCVGIPKVNGRFFSIVVSSLSEPLGKPEFERRASSRSVHARFFAGRSF